MIKMTALPEVPVIIGKDNPLIHILWDACPQEARDNYREFTIGTHCMKWNIKAYIQPDMTYEIFEMTKEPC